MPEISPFFTVTDEGAPEIAMPEPVPVGVQTFCPVLVQVVEPEVEREAIFPQKTQKFLQKAMLHVVISRHGTAKRALPESLLVGGKTGTAETPGKKEDHAWFVFYAPWDDPQIAGAIIVEKAGHGGAVAAPIARKIISQWFGLKDRGFSYWRRLPELQRRGLVRKEPS